MTTSQESDDQKTIPVPQAVKPAANAPAATPAAPATSLEEAAAFARVTDDGHVFVIIDGTEHPVGQYPDATKEEALAYFVRKYDDVIAQIVLLEQRVAAKAPANDMHKALETINSLIVERHMVGDIAALESRVETLRVAIESLQADQRKAAEAARAEMLAVREAIVEKAEELAAKRPEQVQWKTASGSMNELFDQWKEAQRSSVRLPRATEDALWKRFRAARTTFDRHRRAFFSQLDSNNAEAKRVKEELIARAEALQTSTDWGATAAEYRRLMDEWKKSRRASRKDDDALWSRFRAAQDVFFQARAEQNAKVEAEFRENLVVKEALLEEARALLPIKDLAAAKKALDSIRDRWDAAGKVPRGDLQRVESALRQVEDAVKSAEDEQWRRSNPETKARSNSMLSQLQDTIAQLEDDLAQAEAAGNAKQIDAAREALEARRMWLNTLEKSAADFQ
ncbi:DUF349 domain-containing protein [Glutamicibacter endophyticus]|uniref:DUF349 domain-containing protein n=1 Tax=Glutamicibacter endophyticus TaxID=1522174 RepID=UPI003AF0A17E